MSNLPTYSSTQGAEKKANDGLDSDKFHYHKKPCNFF
jgi:hypothetical protein